MIENHSITILIPVYNEETILKEALCNIYDFCKKAISDYEVLIIESGSTDNSKEICNAFVSNHPRSRVIHEAKRNGFGSAVRLGYKEAVKDWIWVVTSDIPFPMEAIYESSKYLDYYDCILSYRSHDPRGVVRRVQSLVYNTIVKITLRIRTKHINSGFKVVKRNFVNQIDFVSKKWFIDAELIYWVEHSGCRYIELPVPIIERSGGASSVGAFAFVDILKEMFYFLLH